MSRVPLLAAGLAAAFVSAPAAVAQGLAWEAGPALARGRDHHAVTAAPLTAGTHALFVAGGTDYRTVFADVWSARVRADGTTEAWRVQPDLPRGLAGAAGVVLRSTLTIVSGQIADRSYVADVHQARIGDDGTLGAWTSAPALPAARFHHAATTDGQRIYVTGGQGAGRSEADVYIGAVDASGRITGWTTAALPRPRSHHASFVHEGHLYVVAGLDGNPASGPALLNDVLRAPVAADGSLGPWRLVSILPYSYATHSAFVEGGALYVMGGVEDNNRFTDAVWRAAFQADGRLGGWERVEPGLPAVRAHVHVTPVLGGRVYSVGGSARRQVRAELDVGRIGAAPADAGVRALLTEMVDAWNRGDLAAHVAAYADSATWVASTGVVTGRDSIQALLARSFIREGRLRGRLRFDDVAVRRLEESLALATGAFVLDMGTGTPVRGRFSLLVRRTPQGWRVVHDHSS